MNSQAITVTVTGAAGQIGYSLLFRIASGQMFGPEQSVKLRLLELPQALDALQGVAMELEDCAFPLLQEIVCTSDLTEAFQGTNWALLVGSVPRKAGMERSDLLKINGAIFSAQGKAINDVAADDVRVLVVGNPCNTNCLITMHHAPKVPRNRFFAMTQLDENRAKTQLALKAQVPVTEVKNMIIWGNHSATQYPDFFNAQISGKQVPEVIQDEVWLQGEFIQTVQQRGAAIIKARGASSAASAANAVVDCVYRLTHTTSEPFSVCLCSEGQYGIEKGLIFSYPCINQAGTIKVVEGLSHHAFSQEKIELTERELKQERDTVRELGLI